MTYYVQDNMEDKRINIKTDLKERVTFLYRIKKKILKEVSSHMKFLIEFL